jgi:hypothetical protein
LSQNIPQLFSDPAEEKRKAVLDPLTAKQAFQSPLEGVCSAEDSVSPVVNGSPHLKAKLVNQIRTKKHTLPIGLPG